VSRNRCTEKKRTRIGEGIQRGKRKLITQDLWQGRQGVGARYRRHVVGEKQDTVRLETGARRRRAQEELSKS
jgi:hypothetical protein